MKSNNLHPPNVGGAATLEWNRIIMELLCRPPKKNGLSMIESLYSKAEPSYGFEDDEPDLLLDLIGFERGARPKTTHLFNSMMGMLFEQIVKTIFSKTISVKYVDSFKNYDDFHSPQVVERYKKRTADCAVGNDAIEIKYRFGSAEGYIKQREACYPLKRLGFRPVFLTYKKCVSPFIFDGPDSIWHVYEGEEALRYIQELSGVDLVSVLTEAMQYPPLKLKVRDMQALYEQGTAYRLATDYAKLDEDARKPIHEAIVASPQSRSKFLQDAGFEDDVVRGFLDDIFSDPGGLSERIKDFIVSETSNKQ